MDQSQNISRKQRLLGYLRIAVSKGFIYNWDYPETCSCGVIAQAITGYNQYELSDEIESRLAVLRDRYGDENDMASPFWSTLASNFCPMTGIPSDELFRLLHENGLGRQEIFHLEYLDDDEILERACISKEPTTIRQPGFLSFVGIRKAVTKEYYEIGYNYFKYLNTWIEILEDELGTKYDLENFIPEPRRIKSITIGEKTYYYKEKQDLENMEIKFVEENDFESAAILRDLIKKIS